MNISAKLKVSASKSATAPSGKTFAVIVNNRNRNTKHKKTYGQKSKIRL